MKTFSEACSLIFLVRNKKDDSIVFDPVDCSLQNSATISEAQTKGLDILKEVTLSKEADLLVLTFHNLHQSAGVSVEEIIKNAFAQGVLVGIEMEKQ